MQSCRPAGAMLLLLASACPAPEVKPPCTGGQVQDAETGECVPEACGTGAWGLLDRDGDTIHVAPWGDNDEDGSEERPLRTVQRGADEAGEDGGGLVALAAGTYQEDLDLGVGHDGVDIAGRCVELVVLDGSGEDDWAVGVSGGDVALRGLTVTGGTGGVAVARIMLAGTRHLRMERVVVERNLWFGLGASDEGSSVDLEDVIIRETQPLPDGTLGRGIEVRAGAALVARGLLLEANRDLGLFANDDGTSVDLEDVIIRETQPRSDGTFGAGIVVQSGAGLTVQGLLVEGNHAGGVVASGAGATADLRDATIRGTQPLPDGTFGRGLSVQAGASLVARGLLLDANHEVGLVASDVGTSVDLQEATIRETQVRSDGTFGRGIDLKSGADIIAWDLSVEGNHGVGILADGAGSTLELHDSTVCDTQPLLDGRSGRGIDIRAGALLTAQGLLVERNHEMGILADGAGVTVELQDATVRDTQPLPDGTQGLGVVVAWGAGLVGRGLLLEGNREFGLYVVGAGTAVDLQDAEISGTGSAIDEATGMGIVVQVDAALSAVGLHVHDNEGPGLYLVADGDLVAHDVLLRGNGFAGAVVAGAGLALHGGEVSGSTACSSEGGGVGVFGWDAFNPPSVEIGGLAFADLVGPALYLRGLGRYVVRDCEVSGTGTFPRLPGGVLARDGVQPWHEVGDTGYFTGLLLQGNAFTDIPSDAILLDSSSATLDVSPDTGGPNTFGALDGVPVLWQRCSGVDAPELLDGSTAAPPCQPTPRTLGPPLEYYVELTEVEPIE